MDLSKVDLKKLSDDDLFALKANDLKKLSDAGLAQIKQSGYKERVAAETEKMREEYSPEKGMSGFDKFVAAYGSAAPMLAKGIGQRLGITSQADVDEAIRINKPLMKTGAGTAGNLVGNIVLAAPTAAIPFANTLTGAATIGAAQGLAMPTETGDSVAKNVAIGAAAAPVVMGAGKLVGKAYETLAAPFVKSVAQKAASNKIMKALGDENLVQARGDINTYYPKNAENIKISSAAITQNPALAQLEQGSRLRATVPWYEFDQRQGKQVFENVLDATKEAEELGARLGERSANWRAAWEKASGNQKPRIWNQRMTALGQDLETALAAPESSNPAVRGVLDSIKSEIERVGKGFSPGHLQQLRANLSGKANPMSNDAFKSAPRDNAAIKSLIAEMDDILNSSTGGKWQNVLKGYANDSDSVRAAKAASKVRGGFIDSETGRIRGVSLDPNGDIAKITEAGIGRAIDAARMPDKSLALSAGASDKLQATLDAIRRQNMTQGLKRSATSGGGSDTVSNTIQAGATQIGTPNVLMQAIAGLRQAGTEKTDNALAKLLSDPDQLAAEITKYLDLKAATKRSLTPLLATQGALATQR